MKSTSGFHNIFFWGNKRGAVSRFAHVTLLIGSIFAGTAGANAQSSAMGMDIYSEGRMQGLRSQWDYNHGQVYSPTMDGNEFRGYGGFIWKSGTNGSNELMRLVAASKLLSLQGRLDAEGGQVKLGKQYNQGLALSMKDGLATWKRIGSDGLGLAFWGNGLSDANNTPQMALAANGQFMINTTSPLGNIYKLNVNGAAFISDSVTIAKDATVSGKFSVAQLATFMDKIQLTTPGNGGGTLRLGRYRNSDWSMLMETGNTSWKRIGADGPLAFWTNGAANSNDLPQLFVTMDGKVGIGTVAPTEKLEVSGSVRATAFLADASKFPDYVFDAGYKLTPLNELSEYITANHKLPGMPSETEVIKQGLNLNDVTIKSVEKIEELTLYIIALQQKIESLERRLPDSKNQSFQQ